MLPYFPRRRPFVRYTVNPPCSDNYLQQAMREFERDETYTISSTVHYDDALNKGENYTAQVYRAKFEAFVIVDDERKEISKSILVKQSPFDDSSIPKIFKFESSVFNNVLIHLDGVYESKLPVLKCIKATEALVITEDFREGGWALSDCQKGWNQAECEKIMKVLAKFHAASIIFSKTNAEKYAELSQYVQDQVYSLQVGDICKSTMADAYEVARYTADQYLPNANPEQASAIQRFRQYTSDAMYAQAKRTTEETANFAKIFVHGDCWANGILLKNSGEGALLNNMGTVCLTSPARDLVYVFASNVQQVDRTRLIEVYVQELHRHLTEHQMDEAVINQFNFEFIDAEVRRFESVEFLTAMWLLLPICFNSFPPLSIWHGNIRQDRPGVAMQHLNRELYKRRVIEVLVQYAK